MKCSKAMKPNEILITVKPLRCRDVVKHFLEKAGCEITGSGYMLPTDIGDLVVVLPEGTSPEEYGPAIQACNLPDGLCGPPATADD